MLDQKKTNEKPVVVVTGCSSGIGMAIARLFSKHPDEFRLVISTREKSIGVLQNEFSNSDSLWILPLDVASEMSRVHFVNQIVDRWGGADIIINNAGVCYRSSIEEMLDTDEHIQMETNYHGPISLIRHFLPRMRKNGKGKIINISSVSAKMAMPTMGSYSASKFALDGAMEALWYELKPFGIDVCQLEPGFVKSKSFERVKYTIRSSLSLQFDKPYTDHYKNMSGFIEKLMHHGFATPESIAKQVFKHSKSLHPPIWSPCSIDALLLGFLRSILPKSILLPLFYIMLPNSRQWAKKFTKCKV